LAKQENQPRQAAWILDHDVATATRVVEFAQEIKSGQPIESPGNAVLKLNGSTMGANFSGDPDEVIREIESITDPLFVGANLQVEYPNAGNLQFNFSLNFALRQLTLNLQNATEEVATTIFRFARSRFPPSPGPSEEAAQSLSFRLASLIREAESAKKAAEVAESAKAKSEAASSKAEEVTKKLDSALSKATSASEDASHRQEESARSSAEIGNLKAQAQADEEAAQKSRESIGAIEAQVRQFFEEIEKNRASITQSEQTAKKTVEYNTTATKAILDENAELQTRIREHLQKAVGASLFSAFQKRKEQISISKWVWAAVVVIATATQAGVFIWLAQSLNAEGAAQAFYERPGFVLRALASIPILFLISYAIRQYARERDFEELYSFKAALSFSLSPYLGLVKELSEKPETESYREFVVKTIGQVFENPLSEESQHPGGSRRDTTLAKYVVDKVMDFAEKKGR